tara:strand:+ start:471 stop:716 length:246 start_codon:yes stop_codon:yes gene_type:complete
MSEKNKSDLNDLANQLKMSLEESISSLKKITDEVEKNLSHEINLDTTVDKIKNVENELTKITNQIEKSSKSEIVEVSSEEE